MSVNSLSFRQALNGLQGVYPNAPIQAGAGSDARVNPGFAANFTDYAYKAVIPGFLYKPAFGYPLFKDISEIRRLGATPFVDMIISTICSEVAGLDWGVNSVEDAVVPDEIISKTHNFFLNPNRNEESTDELLSALVRDILEIDAGVIVKVRDFKDDFREMYVRDGATFTKNPDIFGVLPEFNAYFQYGWLSGARPIPFNRNELVYIIKNKRSDSIYGRSPVEVLVLVLKMLLFGVEANLEYFTDNNIPKGVMKLVGAHADDIKAFKSTWIESMSKLDDASKWKRQVNKMPIINTDGQFERISFSNADLELIEQQKWFTKLVWACFNITPSELGFTDDSNRSTDIIQSNIFKRKAIRPIVQKLEYHFTTEIINDLPWIKGKYEGMIKFEFDKFDLQEELAKRQLFWGDVKNGLRTVNEIRVNDLDLQEIEGGDSLNSSNDSKKVSDGLRGLMNEFGENPAEGTSTNFKSEDFFSEEEKALTSKTVLNPKAFEKPLKPEVLGDLISKELKKKVKEMKKILKREMGKPVLNEVKATRQEFFKALTGLFTVENFKGIVEEFVRLNFLKGLEKSEEIVGANFHVDPDALSFLQSYTFDNVKGFSQELKDDLRQELQRGFMAGEGASDLGKRIQKIADVSKTRSVMIARTEANRASNTGSLNGIRQSGLKFNKEWVAKIDGKTSDVCKTLNGQVIPLNDKFEFKGEKFDSPPALPNCRSTLIFHRV